MLVMRLMLKNPTEMQSKRNKETDDDAHFKDAIKVISPCVLNAHSADRPIDRGIN